MESSNKGRKISKKNKNEIFNFLDRVKLVAAISILIIILFVYIFIYQVMVEESKTSLVDKFRESGNLNHYMVKYSIDRAEEGAKSLSSRTMIRQAAIDYLDGEMSLESLKTYTQDKYIDGVKALDNIVYAKRIVGEESIVEYKMGNYPIAEYSLEEIISKDSITTEINETESTVSIYSPITKNKEIIGHDYLVYTIRNELDSLASQEMKVGLICDNDHINLLKNSELLESEDAGSILETETSFYVLYEIGDKYFYTKTDKADLFGHLNITISRIVIASAMILIFVGLFNYIFIIRYAHNKISNLDESREEFKSFAYIDQLTGAYTRRYLDFWHKNYMEKDKSYSLIMIDVDDFKDINDIYGHSRGDEVLKRIAKGIINQSRDSDIVVRLGGDEFLVILPSANTSQAEKFMERVEKELASMEDITPPVTISFGISNFTEESYEEALEKADELMYRDKKRNEKSDNK